MTALPVPQAIARLPRVIAAASVARAATFAVAVGVFLAAPPSLPWVLAVIALTNVVFLAARAWSSNARPPIGLLVSNGLTVTLVIAYVAMTATQH